MICPACKKAGALNKENNKLYSSTRLRRVLLWHAKCPGKDRCDCQHKTGKVVREGLHQRSPTGPD